MVRVLLFLVGVLSWTTCALPVTAQTPPPEAPRVLLPPLLDGVEYQLGPADVVQIQVWGKPDLSGQATVRASGRVQLPLIGEVQAAGRTPEQLERILVDRYQLLDSSITEVLVSVVQYNSQAVTVLGEVRNPGIYGFQRIPDLWSVLLTAGGPTSAAELSGVEIVRLDETGEGTTSFSVDLSAGIENTPKASLPALQPHDKVVVPSAADVPAGLGRFQILGAVGTPGVYRSSLAADVIEAIAVAGGHASEANLEKVYLTRATANGPQTFRLDVESYLRDGEPLGNMALHPGDTILVEEKRSFWSSFGAVLGRIAPLVSLVVTILLATN